VPQQSVVQSSSFEPDAGAPVNGWPQPGPGPGQSREERAALYGPEVHLWLWPHAPGLGEFGHLASTLSTRESQRAAAFAHAMDRQRYVAAHAFMRRVLAHYTGVDAKALDFVDGAAGKPALAAAQGAGGIQFNLSHSGDVALLGVARDRLVGVDIEVVRRLDDLEALVRTTFSVDERRRFDALDVALRHEAFFAVWTRKEAVIKATGAGLSTELTRIEVTIDPRQPPAVVAIDGSAAAARDWSLWSGRLAPAAWWAAASPQAGLVVQRFGLYPDLGHPK
jgi:4'-phosphopantetheinyl transferase